MDYPKNEEVYEKPVAFHAHAAPHDRLHHPLSAVAPSTAAEIQTMIKIEPTMLCRADYF